MYKHKQSVIMRIQSCLLRNYLSKFYFLANCNILANLDFLANCNILAKRYYLGIIPAHRNAEIGYVK